MFFKQLSPNDNSKNQIYLASHLNELGWFPTTSSQEKKTSSKKKSKRDIRFIKHINLTWIDPCANEFKAPSAKLIYYPQYPEVRFSGFLSGTGIDSNGWMDPSKKGRHEGRILIFGAGDTDNVYAYLAITNSRISREISSSKLSISGKLGYLNHIGSSVSGSPISSKNILLKELKRIHNLGFISSRKLDKSGKIQTYAAQNGGGYTLEAELGIVPNGNSGPDFHGWEIKQFGVKAFANTYNSHDITLFTPEPDGGEIKQLGFFEFIKKYGYLDKKKPDTKRFGATLKYNILHQRFGILLDVKGFDPSAGAMTSQTGEIGLYKSNVKLASWSFDKLLDHWQAKHSKAVYIPSIRQTRKSQIEYKYGSNIRLLEGTTFEMFLNSICATHIVYDGANKVENITTTCKPNRRRSQFRTKWKHLGSLYKSNSDHKL